MLNRVLSRLLSSGLALIAATSLVLDRLLLLISSSNFACIFHRLLAVTRLLISGGCCFALILGSGWLLGAVAATFRSLALALDFIVFSVALLIVFLGGGGASGGRLLTALARLVVRLGAGVVGLGAAGGSTSRLFSRFFIIFGLYTALTRLLDPEAFRLSSLVANIRGVSGCLLAQQNSQALSLTFIIGQRLKFGEHVHIANLGAHDRTHQDGFVHGLPVGLQRDSVAVLETHEAVADAGAQVILF